MEKDLPKNELLGLKFGPELGNTVFYQRMLQIFDFRIFFAKLRQKTYRRKIGFSENFAISLR